MAKKSDRTKSYRTKHVLMRILSILATIGPLLVYIVIGLSDGDIHKGQKVFLGFTVIMAAIFTMLNIFLKHKLRSPLFILLLGIYYAMDNILPLIITISVGTIVDEFLFTPLANRFREDYRTNKQIDARMPNLDSSMN